MKVVYQNLQKNNISRMSSPQIIMISKDKILCMEEEVESVNFGINKGKKLSAFKKYKYFNGPTDDWLFLIFHYIVISILFHNNIHSCNIHNNNCGHSPNIKKLLLGK